MATYLDRAATMAVGVFVGIGISRAEIDPAAIPFYGVGIVLILLARFAVIRHRDKQAAERLGIS